MRLILAFLAAPALWGQLAVFTVQGTDERPVAGIVTLGSVPVSDTLQVQFRVRNTGPQQTLLETLRVAGDGFRLYQDPPMPFSLRPNLSVDFYVRFSSERAISDSRATLTINGLVVTLAATSTAAPSVAVMEDDGSETRRVAGDVTPFLPVERGNGTSRTFVIRNPNFTSLTTNLNVTGEAFRLTSIVPVPLTLAGGQSFTVSIRFQPPSAGTHRGALVLDQRSFPLEGIGTEPLPSRPIISLGSASATSASQIQITINFDTAVRSDLRGALKLDFQPLMTGVEDPAIAFLPNVARQVEFQTKTGESQAMFGSQRQITVQTGTTAGSLILTAELAGYRTEARITIAPAPAVLERLSAAKRPDSLELTIAGYDNSRSMAELLFTFYDINGAIIDPGIIRSPVQTAFEAYYRTAPAGGMFSLRAVFPATGNTTRIKEVQIESRNSIGVSLTQRTAF